MGLFMRNFDKPGPGVSPDAPRKKGAARFFEILGRDFSTIWLAGILAMLGGLPFAAGVWFAVETHSLVPLVIAGVLGGMIAAPQIVGLNDTILRTLRDEPGYWWETYRRTWKRNLKESLLPGAVCGCCWPWRFSRSATSTLPAARVPRSPCWSPSSCWPALPSTSTPRSRCSTGQLRRTAEERPHAVPGLPAPQRAWALLWQRHVLGQLVALFWLMSAALR